MNNAKLKAQAAELISRCPTGLFTHYIRRAIDYKISAQYNIDEILNEMMESGHIISLGKNSELGNRWVLTSRGHATYRVSTPENLALINKFQEELERNPRQIENISEKKHCLTHLASILHPSFSELLTDIVRDLEHFEQVS